MVMVMSAKQMLERIEAEECRRSLMTFAKCVWTLIEPSPFKMGMPVEAMVLHLEAVARGDIRKLVINIPPRHTKSLLVSVIWPVWMWIQNPSERFLCASYSYTLSVRDNSRRRAIIEDPWFQARFGNLFQLDEKQNMKTFFQNNKKGYQMAISMEGGTTGQGGSILLCLCYNTEVTTDKGRICIGDIVEKRLPVKVLSYNHANKTMRWQEIEEYESSPGRSSVRVTFSDGRVVDATEDHPFYVIGKGYIPASQLTNTDRVIVDEGFLRILQKRIQSKTISNSQSQTQFLQSGVPLQLEFRSVQYRHLRSMWERDQANASACRQAKTSFLQQGLFWSVGTRRKQSCLSGWQNQMHLRSMRGNFLSQTGNNQGWQWQVLFPFMSVQSSSIQSTAQSLCPLWLLRHSSQSKVSQAARKTYLLLTQMCQSRPSRIHTGRKEWAICGRRSTRAIFGGISQVSSTHQGTGWTQMRSLSSDSRGEWQRIGCSSYRLRQRSQRSFESGFTLPLVSWQDAWVNRTESTVETLLVRCVEPIPAPERVYNLRIANDHNYFANGVLVHNCDDPHNANDAHSEAKRTAALIWFREVWTNRLNDQEKDKMVTVGQRIHENDVCGYILRERPDWVHLNLPALFEPSSRCITPIWSDPRTEEGELLWPERFTNETLDGLKRDLGSIGFAAQYQQRPVPAGGGQFRQEWIRYFTETNEAYVLEKVSGTTSVLKSSCNLFCTVDLAISLKEENDYTVYGIWARTPENDLILLDVIRVRISNPDQLKQLRLIHQRYPGIYFKIERVGYQLALVQQALVEGIPCKEYNPPHTKDKVARASSFAIWMENEKVFFRQQGHYIHDLIPELLLFPKAPHDDQVDMCSMAADEVTLPQPEGGMIILPIDEQDAGLGWF